MTLVVVPLPIKGAKLQIKLFIEFKFSAQESDLAPFIGNGTKIKIPSEMKPPLKDDNNKKSSYYEAAQLVLA